MVGGASVTGCNVDNNVVKKFGNRVVIGANVGRIDVTIGSNVW